MKIQNTKYNHKRNTFIVIGILLLIFTTVGTILALRYPQIIFSQNEEEKVNKANNDTKKEFIESTDADGTLKDNDNNTPADNHLEVSAKKELDGSVTVFTNLSSLTQGNCLLEVDGTRANISKSAPVIYQDQFSSCAGFSLTAEEVNSLGLGIWSITLTVNDGSSSISSTINFNTEVTE